MVKKAKVVQVVESALMKLLRDPNRFQKLDDGWVRDKLVGVEWGPSSKERMSWAKAKECCANLGGRLPEVNELQSLVDYTKECPAINKDPFSDTQSSWYWTGAEVAGESRYAWLVGFSYGSVGDGGKGNSYYVRPVRASQE